MTGVRVFCGGGGEGVATIALKDKKKVW